MTAPQPTTPAEARDRICQAIASNDVAALVVATDALDTLEPPGPPPDPLADLDNFPGGGDQFEHWTRALRFTEGVKAMADRAGAYWLIDLIASHQPKVRKKLRVAGERDFQVWMLRVDLAKRKAVAECTDDIPPRLPILARQVIEFTDFPCAEMRLWCVDGCLMLPSEY